jgi:CRP-like cAMP-binding protein
VEEFVFDDLDLIFDAEDKSNENHSSLFIVVSGKVELYYKDDIDHPFKTIGPNECFGMLEFVLKIPRLYSAVSTMFTQIIVIKRDQFISLIRENRIGLDY